MSSSSIFFLLEKSNVPSQAQQHAWVTGQPVPSSPVPSMAAHHAWIYQTWLYLNQAGFSVKLVHDIPEEGVLIVHGDWAARFLEQRKYLPPHLFIVDVMADKLPHRLAHFHIVQNSAYQRFIPDSAFVPHWPLASLLPRDPQRGTTFENMAFIGYRQNLDPIFFSAQWQRRVLKEAGLRLFIPPIDQWHDYRQFDVVIAVRRFGKERYDHKPGSKMYNAWLAGVPFIGGSDSAFSSDGIPGRNYLRVTSAKEILYSLYSLQQNLMLRSSLVEEGEHAALGFNHQATLARWRYLIQEKLPQLAQRQSKKSYLQKCLAAQRSNLFCFWEQVRRHGLQGVKGRPLQDDYRFALPESSDLNPYQKTMVQFQFELKKALLLDQQTESFFHLETQWRAILQKMEMLSFYKESLSCYDEIAALILTPQDQAIFPEKLLQQAMKMSEQKEGSVLHEQASLYQEVIDQLKKIIAAHHYWSQRFIRKVKEKYFIELPLLKAELESNQESLRSLVTSLRKKKKKEKKLILSLLEKGRVYIEQAIQEYHQILEEEKEQVSDMSNQQLLSAYLSHYWGFILGQEYHLLAQAVEQGDIFFITHRRSLLKWAKKSYLARRRANSLVKKKSCFLSRRPNIPASQAWSQVAALSGGSYKRELFFVERLSYKPYSSAWIKALVATKKCLCSDQFVAWGASLTLWKIDRLWSFVLNLAERFSAPSRRELEHFIHLFSGKKK